jgi:hypothetical protein
MSNVNPAVVLNDFSKMKLRYKYIYRCVQIQKLKEWRRCQSSEMSI